MVLVITSADYRLLSNSRRVISDILRWEHEGQKALHGPNRCAARRDGDSKRILSEEAVLCRG